MGDFNGLSRISGSHSSSNKDYFMKMRASMKKGPDAATKEKEASATKVNIDHTTSPTVKRKVVPAPQGLAAPEPIKNNNNSSSSSSKISSSVSTTSSTLKTGEGAAAANNKAYFMQMKAAKTSGASVSDNKSTTLTNADSAKDDKKQEELRKLKEEREKLEKAKQEAEEARKKLEEERQRAEEKAKAKAEAEAAVAQKAKEAQTVASATVTKETLPVDSEQEEADASDAATDDKKPIRCRAIMAYHGAEEDGELHFDEGAIIYLPPGTDLEARVLRGVCKGKSGAFLANCVENTATGRQCGPRCGVRCKALGNYTARNDSEISFKQGDTIFVAKKTNKPMWVGVCKGLSGLFPRQLVIDEEEEKELEKSPPKKEVKIKRCRAIKENKATHPDELEFTYGDIILVPKPNSSEVWQGVFKGNVGLFPSSFVVDADEYTKEQIDQMIEVEKQVASTNPHHHTTTTNTAASKGADPFGADPFGADPFARSSSSSAADPFGADPFAQAPLSRQNQNSSNNNSSSSSQASSPSKKSGVLPPVSGAVVAAALSPASQRKAKAGPPTTAADPIAEIENLIQEVDAHLGEDADC